MKFLAPSVWLNQLFAAFWLKRRKLNLFFFSFYFQECSIFLFEKRCAEKLHKPKRKEAVTEILRASVKQLERFRHPKVIFYSEKVEWTVLLGRFLNFSKGITFRDMFCFHRFFCLKKKSLEGQSLLLSQRNENPNKCLQCSKSSLSF